MTIIYTENYEFGGLERFLLDLALELKDEAPLLVFNADNQRLRAFAEERGFRYAVSGVKRRHLDFLERRPALRYVSKLAALLRRHYCLARNYFILKRLFSRLPAPDSLYIVNGGHPGADSCRSAALAAKALGWGKVFYCVLSSPTEIKLPPFRQLERLADRLLFGAVTETHVNSGAIRDALLARLAPLRPPVRVIYTGVSMPPAAPKPAAIGAGDLRLERAPGEVWVATVSALLPLKGNDIVLEAVRLARARNGNIKWLLAGGGPELYGLRKAAQEKGLEGAVVFTGRYPGEIDEVYRFADIFAFGSLHEGLPYVVSEAMANGLPVAAAAVGGIPEQVIDGESGFLVPPGDPAALAEKILLLAGDPALRARMGAAGRARAEKYFSLGRMASAIRSACAESRTLHE